MVKTLDSYMYSIWCWFGIKTRYIHQYNKERDTALANAKQSLEQAFTPELRKMLEETIVNDK
tara:strand:+ start:4499 stop:4684 length:186 start_codon:yes stop_codon:yes gene_type:complete